MYLTPEYKGGKRRESLKFTKQNQIMESQVSDRTDQFLLHDRTDQFFSLDTVVKPHYHNEQVGHRD